MYSSLFMYKMTWICFPKYQFPAHVLSKRTVQTRPFPFSPSPSKLRCQFCATKGLPTFGSTSEDRSHLTSLSLVHTRFVPYRTSPLVCLLYHLFSDSGLPCVLTRVGISPRFSMTGIWAIDLSWNESCFGCVRGSEYDWQLAVINPSSFPIDVWLDRCKPRVSQDSFVIS